MDASSAGDIASGNSALWFLLALLVGIVGWVYTTESLRKNNHIDKLYRRTDKHAQRLTKLDGQTEDE